MPRPFLTRPRAQSTESNMGSRPRRASLVLFSLAVLLPFHLANAQSDLSAPSLYSRGHAALGRGDLDTAIELLEEAAENQPDGLEILFDLGTAHERLGNPSQAIATYRKILRLDPSHRSARKALERLGSIGWSSEEVLDRADLLLERDRAAEATYLYKRYLVDHPDSERARRGLERSSKQLSGEQEAATAAPEPITDLPEQDHESVADAAEIGDEDPEDHDGFELSPVEKIARAEESPKEKPVAEAASNDRATMESDDTQRALETSASDPEDLGSSTSAAESTGDELAENPASRPSPSTEGTQSSPSIVLLAVGIVLLTLAPILLAWRYHRNCTVRGDLEQFPLPDLLQWLGLSKKIGVLKITSSAVIGRIYLEEGKMIHADWSRNDGEKALNRILALPKGRFVFRERSIPRELDRNLDLSIQQALMNWAYQTDQAGRDDEGNEDGEDHSNPLDSVDDESLNIHLPF